MLTAVRARQVLALGLWLAVACTAGAVRAQEAPPRALELHDEARTLYARGQYREAMDKLREAVELDPKGKVLYYNLGLIAEKLGEIEDALRYYRTCLELEPDQQQKLELARIIKRLEGAKMSDLRDYGKAQPPPPPPPPPPEPPSYRPSAWVYPLAASSVAGLGIGFALAARAASLEPGAGATTGDGVTIDDLASDAEDAHGLAIGADIAIGIGAAAGVATVLVAVLSGEVSTDEPAAAGLDLSGGRARWRW